MYLTIYNFLMSLLWGGLFFGGFCLLCRDTSYIRAHGFKPLLLLLLLGLVRSCLTFELPFTWVIPSSRFLPAIQQAVREPHGVLSLSLRELSILIWIAGALVLLIRLVWRLSRQNRAIRCLRRRAEPVATAMAEAMRREAWTAGRCAAVTIPGLDSPAVCGFFSPTVLLPDMEFSEEQLRYILLHELTHFSNRDAWLKLAIAVFQALFWWNPLVYLVGKRFSYILELRCDACTAARFSPEEKAEYADTVLYVTKQSCNPCAGKPEYAFSLAGMSRGKSLISRMELLLSPGSMRKKLSPAFVAAALLLTLLSYSFVVQPEGYPPEEDLVGAYEITTENAQLIQTEDGDYELYIDGEYSCSPSDEFLKYLLYGGLPVEN